MTSRLLLSALVATTGGLEPSRGVPRVGDPASRPDTLQAADGADSDAARTGDAGEVTIRHGSLDLRFRVARTGGRWYLGFGKVLRVIHR